jgi:hypothetical protein
MKPAGERPATPVLRTGLGHLEIRPTGGPPRVLQRRLTEVADGAFAATITLDPGHYWVSAHTQADATNVPGESPPVAAHI